MINFVEVVSKTFEKFCKEKYTVKNTSENIVEVSFKKFGIVLYYNNFEYDLGFNYYCNRLFSKRKLVNLECVLQRVIIDNDKIPEYKFMSNEEVMANYLCEYIALINRYYNELSNLNFGG